MPPKKSPKTGNGLKTNVLILCIFLSMVGLAVVYALDFIENNATIDVNANDSERIEFTIAASKLQAPKSWVESEFNPDKTIRNLIQLRLRLNVNSRDTVVNVTLLPASRAAPSAYLLDSLYIHNFAPGPSQQLYGLVSKKLRNEDGFEDETVWYDALSANPFVAKCLEETSAPKNAKACITTILVNKRVSALIQFEKSLLPDWRQFSTALEKQLNSFNTN